MKIEQITKYNPSITLPSNSRIVHIGAEHWHSVPIHDGSQNKENNDFLKMYNIIINNKVFKINELDILEFDELSESSTISFNGTNLDDYSFITVAYETIEE